MNASKIALVLGVTLIGLIGAVHYLHNGEDIPLANLRGTGGITLQEIENLAERLALFKEWMREHNKAYGLAESQSRFIIWNNVYDSILEHNAKGLSWEEGLNQFSDLTDEEYRSLYLGYKPQKNTERNEVWLDESSSPKDFDWRTKGAVTPVKNQGSCGSCYAFSATGALEALWFLNNKTLPDLSEQQIVDCSKNYGNQGCEGGFMTNCFKYTKDKGIMKSSDYKYTGKVGTCKANSSVLFKNKGYVDVPENKPDQFKAALGKTTVAVAVEAAGSAFKNYKSGIISSNCGTELDHAVLGVGYGPNYWIIKNSWSTSWGEKGYVRIASGTQNSGKGVCGINQANSYPTL